MNQDSNNYNQFNNQGNNENFNNQPLNNQNMNIYEQNFNLYQEPNSAFQTSNVNTNADQQVGQLKHSNKKMNTKLLVIILIAILVVICGIFIFKKVVNKGSNSPVEVLSTFEKNGEYYTLKSENGKVLLDNIKSHGEFCNGTTEIKNTNGEYAIIDGSGKFVVNYGKYSSIEQYSKYGGKYYCFYKAKDSLKSQYYILKYDGSIFYSNDDDKYLKSVSVKTYDTSTKYILFETKTSYKFVNYLGDVFFAADKVGDEAPSIMSCNGENVYDKYLVFYYNNKTYIYDLSSFKQKFDVLDGQFAIRGLQVSKTSVTIAGIENKKENESVIIWGYHDVNNIEKRVAYLYYNGKLTFQTDKCLNVAFVNGNEFRCLIQNGGVFEYYDIKGNKLDK